MGQPVETLNSLVVQFTTVVAPYQALLKFAGLLALVLLMVSVIGLLYSGDVQNAKLGPVSFRYRPNAQLSANTLLGPPTIISNALDQKRAQCTIIFSYKDKRNRSKTVKVWHGHVQLAQSKREARTAEPDDLISFWNRAHNDELDGRIEELNIRPSKGIFSLPPIAEDGRTIPAFIQDYYKNENDDTTTIQAPEGIFKSISASYRIHVVELLNRFEGAKKRNQKVPWGKKDKNATEFAEYKQLPEFTEDAHFYLEMRFSILPWTVLTSHPDGQVKTTAWLTVLTSIFAMVMQYFYNGFG